MTTKKYRPASTEYFLKLVSVNRRGARMGVYANHFRYNKNNAWHKPIEGELIPCQRGYHLVRLKDMHHWFANEPISHYDIWLVKADTKGMINQSNKVVVRNFRFVRQLTVGEISKSIWNDGYQRRDFRFDSYYSKSQKRKAFSILRKWGIEHKNGRILGMLEGR